MQLTTINRDDLSPELLEQLTRFEKDLGIYTGLQDCLTELVQEEQSLKQRVTTFEGRAARTDASWKAMAQSATIDQGKINEEIERSTRLRSDALSLRLTIEARGGVQDKVVIQLAEARMKLVRVPGTINKAYQQTLLSNALAREGVRETLLELFVLSRALLLRNIDEHDGVLSSCNGQHERQAKTKELAWRTFGLEVQKLFDGAEHGIQAPVLAAIPSTVHGEVLVNTLGDLMRVKRERKA